VNDGVAALARFAHAVAPATLPAAVRERAALVLLDTLGVMAFGSQDSFLRRLRSRYASAYSPGTATVIGTGERFDPGLAALLNAAACTVTQLSEGHRRSRGDPGPHIVPAALAVAEVEGAPGEALLAAIVAGYEVAVRAGLALAPLNADHHVHGHWASLGAAVAAVKLLGGDARELQQAIEGTAALLIYAPTATVVEGTTVHHLYVGSGLQAAIAVAYGVQAGMTASPGTLEGYVGRRSTTSFDASKLAAGADPANPTYEILNNYFKLYPVCAQVITAIEAADEIRRQIPDATRVRAVTVRATGAAVALCGGREVHTTLASKFSIPCMVAARFLYPEQGPRELHAIDVQDQALQAMMRRIAVVADPALSPPYPDARPVLVEAELDDGRRIAASRQIPAGDFAGNPIPASRVVSKFDQLVAPILGRARTAELSARAQSIAACPDVRTVTALTRPEPAPGAAH
jgi:2-methylcitrate dehydratase PrpD